MSRFVRSSGLVILLLASGTSAASAAPVASPPAAPAEGLQVCTEALVPSVEGVLLSEAIAMLEAGSWGYTVTYITDPPPEPAVVARQLPQAGTWGCLESPVELFAGPCSLVTLPDVVGWTESDAAGLLVELGYSVQRHGAVGEPSAIVVAQRPDGGTELCILASAVVVLVLGVEPPVTDPPATDPPVTEPPATDPPATDPPVTDPPPTDDPPTTDETPGSGPQVTDPPTSDVPSVTDTSLSDPPTSDDPPHTEPAGSDPPASTAAPTSDGAEHPPGASRPIPRRPTSGSPGPPFGPWSLAGGGAATTLGLVTLRQARHRRARRAARPLTVQLRSGGPYAEPEYRDDGLTGAPLRFHIETEGLAQYVDAHGFPEEEATDE